MTTLTDTDLRELIVFEREKWYGLEKDNKFFIDHFKEDNLTPIGYDLCVGNEYMRMRRGIKRGSLSKEKPKLVIKPNEIVAIKTDEDISMPQNKKYSGIVVSKVSKVEEGLSHISTSIDPDWKGNFIITVANHSDRKVTLVYEQPFCTAMFMKNASPATKDCLKNPDKHLDHLSRKWKEQERPIHLSILHYAIPIVIGGAPIVYMLIKYIMGSITDLEIAIFTACSAFIIGIINFIYKSI